MEEVIPLQSTSVIPDTNVGCMHNPTLSTLTTPNLRYLVCTTCYGYICITMSPIDTADDGKTYCGQCREFRNYVSEEIVQSMTFPCTHGSCSTPVNWANMEQHEQECLHRTVPCPIVECTTLCDVDMLESHFNDFHTELVYMDVLKIADSVLRNSGNKVFLLVSRGIPAIVLVSDVTKKHDIRHEVSVGVFCVVKNFDSNIKYNAEFTLDSENNSTTTTVKNQQIQLYRTSANRLVPMVNVYPYNSIMLRTSLTLKLYKTAEKQQREETEEVDVSDVNPNIFNCPICCQFMCSRIFQCRNGHSFCENCKNLMVSCPSCRGQFGPRNYLLEDIRQRACPPWRTDTRVDDPYYL